MATQIYVNQTLVLFDKNHLILILGYRITITIADFLYFFEHALLIWQKTQVTN